jgi:hypothetical protein
LSAGDRSEHSITDDEAARALVFVKPAGGWTNSTGTDKLSAPQVRLKEYFGESVSTNQFVK